MEDIKWFYDECLYRIQDNTNILKELKNISVQTNKVKNVIIKLENSNKQLEEIVHELKEQYGL